MNTSGYTPSCKEALGTDPAVSFSVELAKMLQPGEVIDVDYKAMQLAIKELGGPRDSSDLSIVLGSQGIQGFSGTYDSGANSIDVNAMPLAEVNQSILHELQHYADRKTLDSNSRTYELLVDLGSYAFGRYGLGLICCVSVLATGSAFVPELQEAGPYILFTPSATVLCLGAISYFDKHERRARNAEKTGFDIVTVVSASAAVA